MKGEFILVALRFLSAAALFTFLASSNLWMQPFAATVLVLGYRLGIFATPWCSRLCGRYTGVVAFALASVGGVAWFLGWEEIAAPAAALGLAVSGYLIKAQAAQSSRGAAWVAVAMNAGSLAAGAVIALAAGQRSVLLLGGAVTLALCALLAWYRRWASFAGDIPNRASSFIDLPLSSSMAWAMIGMATGILVFSIFSILPQTLMANAANAGQLPPWFGWLISINAGIIVLCSVPLAGFTSRLGLMGGVAPLLLGLAALLIPGFVVIDSFMAALSWVLLISLFECGLSALDHLAAQDKSLLVKDASFGVGASLCVLVSRLAAGAASGLVMGVIGLVLTMVGSCLLQANSRAKHRLRQIHYDI